MENSMLAGERVKNEAQNKKTKKNDKTNKNIRAVNLTLVSIINTNLQF